MSRSDADLAQSVRDAAEEWFAGRPAPGLAWCLFRDGQVIDDGGLGQALPEATPQSSTAFRIASITKSFIAATTLNLRDRGVLDLDQPITELLPWIAGFRLPPGGAAPTVRMLLSMSGGFTTDDPWADRLEATSVEDFRTMINSGVNFGSVPGTTFAYSNLGYALLGQALETITGSHLPRLVSDLVLSPLGLRRTGFDTGVGEPLAVGYRWSEGDWQALPYTGPGAFSAIGGLFSTTSDLTRWAGWLADAWHDRGDGDEVLSAASRREMAQISRPLDPTLNPTDVTRGYGYGLHVEQSPIGTVIHHSGGYPGWSAHLRFHPGSGWGIVALANATNSLVSNFASVALAQVLPCAAPEAAPWPQTVQAEQRVTEIIRSGAVELLSEDWVSPNLLQDRALEQRRTDLQAALAILDGQPVVAAVEASSDDPSRRVWDLPVGRGRLRCRISLNPLGQLQALSWTAELPQVRATRRT